MLLDLCLGWGQGGLLLPWFDFALDLGFGAFFIHSESPITLETCVLSLWDIILTFL